MPLEVFSDQAQLVADGFSPVSISRSFRTVYDAHTTWPQNWGYIEAVSDTIHCITVYLPQLFSSSLGSPT